MICKSKILFFYLWASMKKVKLYHELPSHQILMYIPRDLELQLEMINELNNSFKDMFINGFNMEFRYT